MRDFRDAKAMARALRDALKAKSGRNHPQPMFRTDCESVRIRKLEYPGRQSRGGAIGALDALVVSTGGTMAAETNSTLHCSFCGKSQHEVRKLIAGPKVFICDECVGLCNGIIENEEVFDLFAADDERVR